jgi:hypothetical protein
LGFFGLKRDHLATLLASIDVFLRDQKIKKGEQPSHLNMTHCFADLLPGQFVSLRFRIVKLFKWNIFRRRFNWIKSGSALL